MPQKPSAICNPKPGSGCNVCVVPEKKDTDTKLVLVNQNGRACLVVLKHV